jgi:hypothetical protein
MDFFQNKVEFCHDFQNKGSCGRSTCKFLHCSRVEEEEFRASGYLPPDVRDQVRAMIVISRRNFSPMGEVDPWVKIQCLTLRPLKE